MSGKKLILVFLLFLLGNQQGFSQYQHYAIFWGKDQIGNMLVSRIQKGPKTNYDFLADVEFRVLWKYHRTTHFQSVYVGDTLHSCSSKSTMNDDLKDYQSTRRHKDHYRIFRHPSDSATFSKPILFSISRLYYEEPLEKDTLYAEGQSEFCKLEKLEAGSYKLHLPDGHSNTYRYQNGRLQEVEVNRSWFDLVFKRAD